MLHRLEQADRGTRAHPVHCHMRLGQNGQLMSSIGISRRQPGATIGRQGGGSSVRRTPRHLARGSIEELHTFPNFQSVQILGSRDLFEQLMTD